MVIYVPLSTYVKLPNVAADRPAHMQKKTVAKRPHRPKVLIFACMDMTLDIVPIRSTKNLSTHFIFLDAFERRHFFRDRADNPVDP